MRIVICVNRLTGGGAERVASLWIKGFVEQGHSVDVVMSSSIDPVTYEIPANVGIHKIDSRFSNRFIRIIHNLFFKSICLKKILTTINPNVVITVMPEWIPLIDKICPHRTFKLISTEHSAFEHPTDALISSDLYMHKFESNKKADVVTVLTNSDKICIGSRLDNVVVLPNPLTYKPVEVMPSKDPFVLAVGRLDGWYVKGFDILINAWAKIANDFPTWKLVIAGGGRLENKERLEILCEELNVSSSVEFVGFVDPLSYYLKASIFVLSSRYEGFGMVLTEAMSQGCACVACDWRGRQADIISNDKEGILCRPNDINDLAYAISRLIKDSNFRKLIQHQAIIKSKEYELDVIMNQWNTILNN
nr:glycosyltransferase [Bacteroidales bacterium]